MANITKITIVDTEQEAQWGKPTGRNYARPTQTDRLHIALNSYDPGSTMSFTAIQVPIIPSSWFRESVR